MIKGSDRSLLPLLLDIVSTSITCYAARFVLIGINIAREMSAVNVKPNFPGSCSKSIYPVIDERPNIRSAKCGDSKRSELK